MTITLEQARSLPREQYQILRAAAFEFTRIQIRRQRQAPGTDQELVELLAGVHAEEKLSSSVRELDDQTLSGLLLNLAAQEVLDGY